MRINLQTAGYRERISSGLSITLEGDTLAAEFPYPDSWRYYRGYQKAAYSAAGEEEWQTKQRYTDCIPHIATVILLSNAIWLLPEKF